MLQNAQQQRIDQRAENGGHSELSAKNPGAEKKHGHVEDADENADRDSGCPVKKQRQPRGPACEKLIRHDEKRHRQRIQQVSQYDHSELWQEYSPVLFHEIFLS